VRPAAPATGQLVLALGGNGPDRPGASGVVAPAPGDVAPEWLSRLRGVDLRRAARSASDGRPLVFLVDARGHWSLLEPRLPPAGFDPIDFEQAPDGDLRFVAFADTSPGSVDHLLQCLRRSGSGRAVVCDRLALTGPRLAALALGAVAAAKNSRTGA